MREARRAPRVAGCLRALRPLCPAGVGQPLPVHHESRRVGRAGHLGPVENTTGPKCFEAPSSLLHNRSILGTVSLLIRNRGVRDERSTTASVMLVLIALATASASPASLGSAETTLFWASGPVAPNETLLVAGAGLSAGSRIAVHLRYDGKSSAAPVVVKPAKVSDASVVFTLPATLNPGAYTVQVCDQGAPTACSNALPVNRAELWWVAGDAGNRSTAGGWVRLFGTGLDFAGHSSGLGGQGEAAALEEQLQHALRSRDVAGIATLANELSELLGGRSGSLAPGARGTAELQLQLQTPEGQAAATAPVVIPALNGSLWDATFALPASLAPGVYQIAARNQYQSTWTALDAFSKTNPHARTIEVVAAPAKGKVFAVVDYMQQCGVPNGGLNFSTGAAIVSDYTTLLTCYTVHRSSSTCWEHSRSRTPPADALC